MYSSDNIQSLFNRLGWRNLEADKLENIVNDSNKVSESGRYFEDFSSLVTLNNLYKSVEEPFLNDRLFNEKLKSINESVVFDVLDRSFNYSERSCKVDIDKNDFIENKIGLFDQSIGYGVAIKSIEIMLMSQRNNIEERRVKDLYDDLMVELNGIFDNGKVLQKGLVQKFEDSIKNNAECLFGSTYAYVDSVNLW